MRKNFEDLKGFIQRNNPQLEVRGELYPPPAYAAALSQLAGMMQLAGMAMAFGGDFLFGPSVGLPMPSFYPWMKENRTGVMIGLFLFNSFASNLMATGAFEVYVDGVLEHSRLTSGVFPTAGDIIHILQEHGIDSKYS
jgi:selT/selW/selH-like putative selenoprotein